MSDNRKYYYLKLKENYFDDDSIVLLESMQDGVLYSNILLKLYLKSLKHGGRLQLDEDIPYTAQMIATITRQQIGTVERALQIFLKLGLVEVLDSGTFYMSNIELLIGQSSTEAERKRAARLQNKALSAPRTNGGHLSDIRPPEIEMKEITERLEQGVKDIFTSEMYTTYLRTMAKFHNYSFNNTLLIAMQRPDATLVAGFNAWKNKFNRYVKKGEKGIQIIAPAPIKEVEEREKIDKDTGLAVLNENGEPEMERVEYVIPRFRLTTVFDVSQTDGEPIPSLEVNELTARVKDYALLTAAIEQVSPVPMRFDEIEGEAKGYYSDADKEICIQVGMGESQTIKTMIHEVAHAMLHNSDLMKQRGEEKDRLTKETEAESIA